MHPKTFLLSALSLLQSSHASFTNPNNTLTTSIFLFDTPTTVELYASLITVSPSATTLRINCPPGQDCGFLPGATVTINKGSIYDIAMTDSDAYSLSAKCTAAAGAKATCVEVESGPDAEKPGTRTETYEARSVPVTVTAGLEDAGVTVTNESAGGSGNAKSAGGSGSGTGKASGANVMSALTRLSLISVIVALVA